MGRPPRRGQPLNKGQDGGSERVRYSEVSLYLQIRISCFQKRIGFLQMRIGFL